jgi:signal transduction histidine kinase
MRVADESAKWPFAEAVATRSSVLVEGLSRIFGVEFPGGPWPEACERAHVVPLPQVGASEPAGLLVVGLSPRLLFDAEYKAFMDRVATITATAIANARAHEQERRRVEALTELDRAKTAFFSNLSHEFRTPLTLMLGPIEDILAKPGDQVTPDNRELLAVVHRSGLRLQRLVNTLLDFSRIEAGRAQASFEPTDLGAFTAELASSFRSAMDRAGLGFTVDCEQTSEPVYVDREMWEKIVLNLLSNAFKYTLEGSVAIQLNENNHSVELSVQDTGSGIPEEELPSVFDRFHRIESTRGRTHEGTGIGLALVHELVKLHGGSVAASSEVGRGSNFTVRVPLGSAHLPAERIGAGRTVSSTALYADAYVEEALRWLPQVDAEEDAQFGSSQLLLPGVRSRVLLADDNADMREYV